MASLAVTAVIVLGSVGCVGSPFARAQTPDQDRSERNEFTDCERSIGISGLEAPLTIGQMTRRADLVVVGTVTADKIERLTSVPGVPPEERDALFFAFGSYHDATLEVTEYLKGNGPLRISVRRLASTRELCVSVSPGPPELAVGTRYVLFLERGRGVWTGGYIVFGRRGTFLVANGVARSSMFGDLPPFLLRLLMTLP